jgi:hypothetical protein
VLLDSVLLVSVDVAELLEEVEPPLLSAECESTGKLGEPQAASTSASEAACRGSNTTARA